MTPSPRSVRAIVNAEWRRHVRFIDVGQEATGVIAIGQIATGVLAIGQFATA